MTKYLISFPSEAMALTDEEFPIVSAESHAVIEEAKAAGGYVFGGGIEEEADPVLVSRRRVGEHRDLSGLRSQGWVHRAGAGDARGRGRVGEEDRGCLPLLAGVARVYV
jgi:hypothetical protein